MQRIHTHTLTLTVQSTNQPVDQKSFKRIDDDASARIGTANPSNTLFLLLSVCVLLTRMLCLYTYFVPQHRCSMQTSRLACGTVVFQFLVISLCHRSRFVRRLLLTSHLWVWCLNGRWGREMEEFEKFRIAPWLNWPFVRHDSDQANRIESNAFLLILNQYWMYNWIAK